MKMYDELADWWHLISEPEDYREEARIYAETILDALGQTSQSSQDGPNARPKLLELGSGGGNNASFMKAHFAVTLVDPSPKMRAQSQDLNPECAHAEGDMRTYRHPGYAGGFDAVFVHDAICYMTTEADLRATFETAHQHLRPGGVALFAPDFVRETFQPGTDCGGNDAADDDPGRGIRFLEWVWDPDPDDTTYVVDYTMVMRVGDGPPRVAQDRHVEGLFPRGDWTRWLQDTGFDVQVVPPNKSELPPDQYEMFLAWRR